MNIYQYIAESRRRQFRTAKAFWKSIDASFSYEYYSNIERGSKFPNIQTVLFLCEPLDLNKKKACFLWAQESMPDKESRSFFRWDDEVIEKSVPIGPQIRLENTFLVTDRHLKLLESSPLYWEILSFFAMYEEQFFTLQELIDNIDIPKNTLLKILGDLVEHRLLNYSRRRYAHPKAYMHIPNDRQFFKLRNSNFLHTSKQLIHGMKIKDVEAERAFRTTVNKKITDLQIARIMNNIKHVVGNLLNLPSPTKKKEGRPFTLCVLCSERDFSNRTHR